MLFNSAQFAIFLVLVFSLYWIANKSLKLQNLLLLVASFVFYGWWDYRFLFLLVFSIFLDYFTGLRIHNSNNQSHRKAWLFISIVINLGFLGFFKYYNFFVDNMATLIANFGFHPNIWTLNIVLPVGISFYTFHGVSYVLDIYNRRIEPTQNFVDYSVFVSFFPLLVAGPIERATHLLPQVQHPRRFDYDKAADGLRQILWGLFKKIVIADNCASSVNVIFSPTSHVSGSTVVVGMVLFTIQIYGDFSGYSDIALGTARLFGFELLRNFDFPYFSKSITEFWRRWHISLSTWFFDYIYNPTVARFRDWGKGAIAFGLLLTFFLSGFWHGAGWKFIVYGLMHGLAIVYEFFTKKNRKKLFSHLPVFVNNALSRVLTFSYVSLCFLVFRAADLKKVREYFNDIFSRSLFTHPQYMPKTVFLFSGLLLLIEWFQRDKQHALQIAGLRSLPARWSIYVLITIVIISFGLFKENEFIYFQF